MITEMEYAKQCLISFCEKLREIEKQKTHGINIFDAVGVHTQEVKHSYFLAWLLNPSQKHLLGNAFLKKFLEKLFLHKNNSNEVIPALKTNKEILALGGIRAIDDLSDFLSTDDITVETEKVLTELESRMDIYVKSDAAKTVLVIENKVFSSTHDEQLYRYEKQFEEFIGWKKIFVYLTPEGFAPYDFNEYRAHWCVFSYRTIIKIINELNKELLKTKENLKLKMLMEDYIEMVDVNILKGNKELKNLCKQIRREHKDAIDLLLAYTDNGEQSFKYCADKIKTSFTGIKIIKETKNYFDFYTESLEKYFSRRGEDIKIDDKRVKCRFCLGNVESVDGGVCMDKDRDGDWSAAQLKIKEHFAPGKKTGNVYFSLPDSNVQLLSEADRELDFDNIKPQLDAKLQEYIDKLKSFELKLNKI